MWSIPQVDADYVARRKRVPAEGQRKKGIDLSLPVAEEWAKLSREEDAMIKLPRPPHRKTKVEPYSGQAHSLNEERIPWSDAVQLALNLSKLGGQELGQGRFELPLSGSRPAKTNVIFPQKSGRI